MGYVLARQGPTGQQCHCYLPTTRVSVQKSVDRETDCNEAQSNIPKQFSTRFDAKFLRFLSQLIERNARLRCRLVLPDCSASSRVSSRMFNAPFPIRPARRFLIRWTLIAT